MADLMSAIEIVDIKYDLSPSLASVGIQFRSPHSFDKGSHVGMSCLRI